MANVELHIKIEQDDTTKLEATVTNFDTNAGTTDTVTIYNDGPSIAVKVYFPGESALATNPINVTAGQTSGAIAVTANTGTYRYIISSSLPYGGTLVIDPRFIIGGGSVTP